MNTLNTLKIGDLVYFDYGMGCGSEFGTVMGFETDRWGSHAWVRKSDFSMTTVENLRGTVTVKHGVDYEGTPYMSARPLLGMGIGSYLVVG